MIVGEQEHLAVQSLEALEVNWIDGEPPQMPIEASCRIRYRHREVPSMVVPLEEGRVRVNFAIPQQGVTPGQAAVFYRGEEVLGGVWIA